MKRHPLALIRSATCLLASLVLSGCNTGGEYNAPKSPPPPKPSTPPTSQNYPPAEPTEDPTQICGVPHPGPGGLSGLQAELMEKVSAGKDDDAFQLAFHEGDELFETSFTRAQGGGSHVGPNQFFTRVPRADLKGEGEWFTHKPDRPTGPNAQSCTSCHNTPGDDGSGNTAVNVHRDPLRNGKLNEMIQRNTPHIFGAGALQLLAEEMTAQLHAQREAAAKQACESGQPVTVRLSAKGEEFGELTASCKSETPAYITDHVKGVADDLVVRPYQWKKSVTFMRDFARGASNNELGMQPVEFAGEGQDKDGDHVTDEMGYGQVTALTVYMAAQPRPITKTELVDLNLAELKDKQILKDGEREAIGRGETLFKEVGCDVCHRPTLTLEKTVYNEPSRSKFYRDEWFCSGQDPQKVGVDFKQPIHFDLTRDLPDNRTKTADGEEIAFGNFTEKDSDHRTIVRLYGDLRRHNMGPELAEPIDELGNGKQTSIQYKGGSPGSGAGHSTFGTKELWGLACTGPWLHDGRATTIAEAVLAHGGEGQTSRDQFKSLDIQDQGDLLAFLENLVLYKSGLDFDKWKSDCGVKVE